ncbi:hypothetical protein B0A55_00961 [Friedmanniomyces simplex]|uniref:Uncharacterized protein n=1 Tax=Friedmanniomyces simplex TaxID=329884 RepID=A0A4V5NIP6_9PEZI|nr:hypothetical protein B0A55_00961 [Friedmanniomyces simplex]
MKKVSAGRRVPRKVGQDDDEPAVAAEADEPEPALRRPTIKPRKSTSLRKSFTPSAGTEEEDGSDAPGVVTPKRSNVARIAIQRNAAKRAVELPRRVEDEGEDSRPSYDTASLNELKASTPSTPRDFASGDEGEAAVQDVSQATHELDLSSKFGSSLARYQQQQAPSAIPSATEIAEKKARRARLAQEQAAEEYISLDPDDPGLDTDDDNVMTDASGRLVLKEKDKWNEAESRLVKEDEDILENFEEFTEDGKIHLGRKAEKEAAKRRKQDMAAQIAAAEGSDSDDDSDSDASEKHRIAAYEASQTRHGTYGATHNATPSDPYAHLRPRTPPKITTIPTLDSVIERLRRQVAEMQSSRARKLQDMSALQREKVRLAEEEVRIQRALKETAEKFQELRREKGIASTGASAVEAPAGLLTASAGGDTAADGVNRRPFREGGDGDEGEDEEDEAATTEHAGMGLGFAGMSATPGLGMSRLPADEDDW